MWAQVYSSTADDPLGGAFGAAFAEVSMEAMADAGPEALNNFRKELIDAQRKKVYGMISWSPIWAYYHLLKSELQVEENSDGR